jgi:molybdate-binding protein/DNA-binding XRE family transcriptional regulator
MLVEAQAAALAVRERELSKLSNSLRVGRQAAGLSQEALGQAAGISRQAYAAVEGGSAVPSTEVALRLARALGTTVEQLFLLPEAARPVVVAEMVGDGAPPAAGQRVRLVRVGGRLLARPLSGASGILRLLPWADGLTAAGAVQAGGVRVELLDEIPGGERPLVMVGCDPAAALLALVLQGRGVELMWSEEGSVAALEGLARGEAHVAGCHLLDSATGLYNQPWIARLVPFPCTLVHFAVWEQGLIVAAGNPQGLRTVADLLRPGVRIVNRPAGTGARMLLERGLAAVGARVEQLDGHDRQAAGHLAVAEAVRSGLVDAGIGVQAAAVAAGLDFVPLGEERYDLVIPNHYLDVAGVAALLDVLRRPALRAQVETLGGYDAAAMGEATAVGASER